MHQSLISYFQTTGWLLKKNVGNFLLIIFICLTSCQKETEYKFMGYTVNNSRKNGSKYFKQCRVNLIGVVQYHEKRKKYCFFIASEFQSSAGCQWDELPLDIVEKKMKSINKEIEDLWFEVECEPKFVNYEIKKYKTNDYDLWEAVQDEHRIFKKKKKAFAYSIPPNPNITPSMKLEKVKILKVFLDKKHPFKTFGD